MNAPTPYQGKEKYIFISYSHRDTNKVFPIISALMENGYRVWYDQGIDPGTEWDENIAMHINDCGYFIAFMSSNYLGSNNCKDELNYARDLEKDRLIVYLEEVTLPAGMAMRVNRLQSIFHYAYTNQADFYEKLFAANNIDFCLDPSKAKPKAEPQKSGSASFGGGQPGFSPVNNTGSAQQSGASGAPRINPVNTTPTGAGYSGYYGQGTNPNQNPNSNPNYNTNTNTGYDSRSNTTTSFTTQNSWALPVKSRTVAALLAFFLGMFGAHNFYLGEKFVGILKIVFYWTFIPTIIGIIDAVKLFTMSDAAFEEKYKCRVE